MLYTIYILTNLIKWESARILLLTRLVYVCIIATSRIISAIMLVEKKHREFRKIHRSIRNSFWIKSKTPTMFYLIVMKCGMQVIMSSFLTIKYAFCNYFHLYERWKQVIVVGLWFHCKIIHTSYHKLLCLHILDDKIMSYISGSYDTVLVEIDWNSTCIHAIIEHAIP